MSLVVTATITDSAGASAVVTATATQQAANGWTVFTQSSGDKTFYVSSSAGLDTNDGLSQTTPLKTIAAAVAKMTSGHADWCLLKCGDTWTDDIFGGTNGLHLNGRSASQPMLFSSYGGGSQYPIIQSSGGNYGLYQVGDSVGHGFGQNLAFVDLWFYSFTRDPFNSSFKAADAHVEGGTGIFWDDTTQLENILIEGCRFSHFSIGLQISPSVVDMTKTSTMTIRRCIVDHCYTPSNATTPGAMGIIPGSMYNQILDQNLVFENGWSRELTKFRNVSVTVSNSTITWTDARAIYLQNGDRVAWGATSNGLTGYTPANAKFYYVVQLSGNSFKLSNTKGGGAISLSGASGNNTLAWADCGPTIFNHNVYLSGYGNPGHNDLASLAGPAVITGNMFFYDGAGNQYRSGFNPHQDNLYSHMPYVASMGAPWAGVVNLSKNNVVLNGVDVPVPQAPDPRTGGAYLGYQAGQGLQTEQFNYDGDLYNKGTFLIDSDIIAHNLTGTDGYGIGIDANYSGNTIQNCIFVDWMAAAPNPGPIWDDGAGDKQINNVNNVADSPNGGDRTVLTYNRDVLGRSASLDDFLTQALLVYNKRSWDVRYTADAVNTYVRSGFGR